MQPILHHKVQGSGTPLIIIHGLFGSLDNWSQIAKSLAADFTVITVDLRNHGRSFHADDFTMNLLAEDLFNLWQHLKLKPCFWMGHSLGGKAVMQLASDFPACVSKLIVVDIAPKDYPRGHDQYFQAMEALPIEGLSSRGEADKLMSVAVNDQGVRLFLLKNLARSSEGFRWKINLTSLKDNYAEVVRALILDKIDAPTLFIRGKRSDYIEDSDFSLLDQLFADSKVLTIDQAGHWVHADAPTELIAGIRDFLT